MVMRTHAVDVEDEVVWQMNNAERGFDDPRQIREAEFPAMAQLPVVRLGDGRGEQDDLFESKVGLGDGGHEMGRVGCY